MKPPLCPECKRGPRGVEGHAAIAVDHYPERGSRGGPVFRCAHCGRYWRRDYVGDGFFQWSEFEQAADKTKRSTPD
jgi:hypothetical protein